MPYRLDSHTLTLIGSLGINWNTKVCSIGIEQDQWIAVRMS